MKQTAFALAFIVLLSGSTLLAQQPGSMRNHIAGHRTSSDPAMNRPALHANASNQNRAGIQGQPVGPRRMEQVHNPALGNTNPRADIARRPYQTPSRTVCPVTGHCAGPAHTAPPIQKVVPVPVYRAQQPLCHHPAPPPVPVHQQYRPAPPPPPVPAPPRQSFLECLLHPIINLEFQL